MKPFLIQLKIILQSKLFYIFLFILTSFYVIYRVQIKESHSVYQPLETEFICKIIKIKPTEYGYSYELEGKENLISYIDNNSYQLGDVVYIKGTLEKPQKNTILNNFNYQEYLLQNGIYYLLNIEEIKLVNKNQNIIFKLKNRLQEYMNTFKAKNYLNSFILGDTSYLSNEIYSSYQENGICHLLAIGSSHISLFSLVFLSLFKRLKLKNLPSHLLLFFLIYFYLILTDFPISILRSYLYLIVSFFNIKLNLKIKPIYLFLIILSITLLINPFYIFHKGFLYSYSISFILILTSKYLTGNYFIKLLKISFISFLYSVPFNIYFNYSINLFSIFYNLIFVPIFNIIVFPLSLLTLILPFLDNIFYTLMTSLENLSLFFNQFNWGILILRKISVLILIFYFLLITFVIFNTLSKKKIGLILLTFTLIIHFHINSFLKESYFIMIDVKQGDSNLLYLEGKTILIDTGGVFGQKISDKEIIMFKSLGIKKIDYLILTHGDYDHMGEAINLVENFRVEKVIFNCGPFNDLEKELIKVLDKRKIKYYSCIRELNIDDNKLYFLNNGGYDNENDNSSVIYTELNSFKFLFMGDAGGEVEQDLIEKYNLKDIDILKVGHHGSRTSSSKEFINEISPKYSLISVGKNNRYGHPNTEVLNVLDNSRIYRTDQDGSIMFKIKSNKLYIELCVP